MVKLFNNVILLHNASEQFKRRFNYMSKCLKIYNKAANSRSNLLILYNFK